MRQNFIKKIFLSIFIITTAVSSHAQKQVTITSSKENNWCNSTCTLIDVPELNNNYDAIIFVTPKTDLIHNGVYPHPITVYYTGKQWSIMNLDNTAMQPGSQFDVEYYTQPDATHFVHVVTTQNLQNKGSYIDHAGLNDNPNVQFRFFQNFAPPIRGGIGNRYNIKIQYDTTVNRWYMSNTNGRQLDYADAYNIAITSSGNGNTIPVLNKSNINVDTSNTKSLTNNNNNAGVGWSLNGAQLYSTNQGFVGIAWKNPTSPLGFSPSLGKKISLYPGTTGDAGFGVAPNRLQIFSDNPNADVAIGYDAAGSFNERFAVKANGSLAVNGNIGQAGQVLQSNGAGAAPTWIDFKTQYYRKEISAVTLSDNSNFININIPIIIKVSSVITVSVTADLSTHSCAGDGYSQLAISAKLLNGGGLVQTSMGQFTKPTVPGHSSIATGEIPLLSLYGTVATLGAGSNVLTITLSKLGTCPYLDIGGGSSSAIIIKVIPQ